MKKVYKKIFHGTRWLVPGKGRVGNESRTPMIWRPALIGINA
jgi:hypothetical protein